MALRGTTQILTTAFYESPGGPLVEPTGVALNIYLDGVLVLGPVTIEIERISLGLYQYAWMIPLTAVIGDYQVVWSGTLPGDVNPTYGYETVVLESILPGVPGYGGCPWPVDPACETAEWIALTPEVRQRSLRLASSTLERLSGYRVANCPITVRPQPQSGFCGIWTLSGSGLFSNGYWAARTVGATRTGANAERGIRLPGPVGRIDQVKVDGIIISPLKYHVERDLLIWHSADPNPFPDSQNLDRLDTEVGTFSVTYLNAYPVDALGAYAVGVLALEFAKACTPGKKCRLPDSVTSIVRQGVSMEIQTGTFPGGVTGIREVDSWIGLWNPGGLKRAVQIYSPDRPRTAITTVRP